MPLIRTNELTQATVFSTASLQNQIYNGLDCCVTHEVFGKIGELHPGHANGNLIYDFERALQAPALEMMLRGILIDQYERRKATVRIRRDLGRLCDILDRYVTAIRGTPLTPRHAREANRAVRFTFPNSRDQLCEFFYSVMKLPEQSTYRKGEKKVSMDRETLEKLQVYWHAQPVILCILRIRELDDQLSVLETAIDPDGRLRQSYNIAGTETGRPSSSASSRGTGTNIQNITRDLRSIFCADTGWKIAAIDFEQSEARDLGWWCWLLFGDPTYLDACEGSDLHTTVSKLVWPNLGWIGDAAADRKLAEQIFYRHFTYRDMAKRGGHGTNYLGTPATMARHLKVPQPLLEVFQKSYFAAFSALGRLHRWVAQELQTKQSITSFFGRHRIFFGRPNDDATLREAVANMGQSPTADRTSLCMWRIWKHLPQVRLWHEVYDAVYCQYREEEEQEILPKILALTKVELQHNGRSFIVPSDAKVGWNWGDYADSSAVLAGKAQELNMNGLKKWKGSDTRKRAQGLERVL